MSGRRLCLTDCVTLVGRPCPRDGQEHSPPQPDAPSRNTRHLCATAPSPSWIPAFAGMTTGSEWAGRHPDRPSAIANTCLLYAASGHACMDAGGAGPRQAAGEARSRPAKAGIQAGGVGGINGLRLLPARWNYPFVLPATASLVITHSNGRVRYIQNLCCPARHHACLSARWPISSR